jgi:hypothetical protein
MSPMPADQRVYDHPAYRRARAYWQTRQQREGLHCARCGRPITTTRGPWALDVGHIVAAADALRRGWDLDQINAIENTRPEHRRCNRSAGARLGNTTRTTTHTPTRSGVWP